VTSLSGGNQQKAVFAKWLTAELSEQELLREINGGLVPRG
jgi:ABC-type sugar transport system ATPase subunit